MENAMRKGCLKLPIYCHQGEHHILLGAFLLGTSIKEKALLSFGIAETNNHTRR
jgi:hypothetical protein